jgi:hypothetical protein
VAVRAAAEESEENKNKTSCTDATLEGVVVLATAASEQDEIEKEEPQVGSIVACFSLHVIPMAASLGKFDALRALLQTPLASCF